MLDLLGGRVLLLLLGWVLRDMLRLRDVLGDVLGNVLRVLSISPVIVVPVPRSLLRGKVAEVLGRRLPLLFLEVFLGMVSGNRNVVSCGGVVLPTRRVILILLLPNGSWVVLGTFLPDWSGMVNGSFVIFFFPDLGGMVLLWRLVVNDWSVVCLVLRGIRRMVDVFVGRGRVFGDLIPLELGFVVCYLRVTALS
jgi:hypothetical protein